MGWDKDTADRVQRFVDGTDGVSLSGDDLRAALSEIARLTAANNALLTLHDSAAALANQLMAQNARLIQTRVDAPLDPARVTLTAAALTGLIAARWSEHDRDWIVREAQRIADLALAELRKEHGSREPLASPRVESAEPSLPTGSRSTALPESATPSPGAEDANARHSPPAGEGARWIPSLGGAVCSKCGRVTLLGPWQKDHERACWHAGAEERDTFDSKAVAFEPAPSGDAPLPDDDWHWCHMLSGGTRVWCGEYADEGEPDMIVDICGNEAESVARWMCAQHNGRPEEPWEPRAPAAPGEDAMVRELVEAIEAHPHRRNWTDPDVWCSPGAKRITAAVSALYSSHRKPAREARRG